jgi:hypothetical protein
MAKLPLILASLSLALATPSSGAQELSETFLPAFDPALFSGNPQITNPYFPVIEGQERTFKGSPANESFVFTGLGAGPVIHGVKTFTVRDRAYEGTRIVEDTFDYYTQDRRGNVWYMGEDVTNYRYDRNGNLIGTDSSSTWRAGVNGAKPGYIMPASTEVNFNYYQEFAAADDALDEGTTVAVLPEFTTGPEQYADVVQVLETTELDQHARGFKYYARGIGLVYEAEGLRPNFKHPRQVFELVDVSP